MLVLLIIVALLAFILLLRVKIVIVYAETLALTVKVLGLPFPILPARQKKVRIGRYSLRRMRKKDARRRLAQAKRAAAKRQKAAEKKQRKAEQKAAGTKPQRPPLDQTVRMVLALVKIIFARFGRHLRIDVTRLRLTVATGDAAGTAILWGAVCPAVGALLEILDRITNLRTLKHCEIDVQPDFTAETFSADVCIAFSLCVWQVFDIALRALFGFIRHRALPQTPAQSKPKA
ncbi:MAG: DUF2953 domain-containing protein [Clostridia bacterium]|nr:DUF2953 domain-containing protein [Clostridia bacterium]